MFKYILLASFFFYHVNSQGSCKNPYVEQRLLADDVRYASPFYVVALPKTAQTLQMDNVCYTYFEKEDGGFFHIMSITYKNGTNTYYDFTKGDISNRMGIAEGRADDCVYHDYTLKPICNVTVFILYRCYISGQCSNNIDISPIRGVDVRVTLAASPKVSPECRAETESSLRDTSALAGGDYVILPQKLTPNCITKYDGLVSIGSTRALGPKEVVNDVVDRFAAPVAPPAPSTKQALPTTQQSNFFRQGIPPPSAFNPYGRPATTAQSNGFGSQSFSSANSFAYGKKGGSYSGIQSSAPVGPTPTAQPGQPGVETHYHIWQAGAAAAAMKAIAAKNPNVYYHIHSFAPPQGCCQCV